MALLYLLTALLVLGLNLEKLPGAPWADGTIGGVLAVNGDHGRMHWSWVREGIGATAQA